MECDKMKRRIIFLVDKMEQTDGWSRSDVETLFRINDRKECIKLIDFFSKRSLDMDISTLSVGDSVDTVRDIYEKNAVLVNLSIGSDFDGISSIKFIRELENRGIPFVGPGSSLLSNTIDKIRLSELCAKKDLPFVPLKVCLSRDLYAIKIPCTINPADSYVRPHANIEDYEQLQTFAHQFKHFPLFIVEEKKREKTIDIFVRESETFQDENVAQDAIDFAKKVYYSIGGVGLIKIVLVAIQDRFEIVDVEVANVIIRFQEKYGAERAAHVLFVILFSFIKSTKIY